MKILVCDNRREAVSNHDICLQKMKQYIEKIYKCSFEMKNDGKDVIYVYNENEDFISIRTVERYPDEKEWIKDTTKIIDDFCTSNEDGFLVMHIGLGRMDKANYYNYPSIRAIMASKIRADHVIIYSTYKIFTETFYNETSYDYNLMSTRDIEVFFETVKKICSKGSSS